MTILHNPFTLLYDELWNLLEQSPELSQLVAVGNRLKFNDEFNREPLKETVATADMPEILILSDGGDFNLMNSSSTSRFDLSYSIVINTGDYRLNVFAHQIQWFIFCQFVKWKTTLTTLTWKNEAFVKNVRLSNVTTGESMAERNRGINGFTTVCKILVEVIINTANIVPTQ